MTERGRNPDVSRQTLMIGRLGIGEAQRLVDEGVPLQEIARRAGCHPSNLSKAFSRGKLVRR